MTRFKQSLLMLACVFLLTGCGLNTGGSAIINHKAQVKKLSDGGYLVKISWRVTIRRRLRPPFQFLYYPAVYNNTYWFYFARTNGTVDASNVLAASYLSNGDLALIKKTDFDNIDRAIFKDMTGTTCFSNGMMTVNLNQTFRPDASHSFTTPFFLNGTYQLE